MKYDNRRTLIHIKYDDGVMIDEEEQSELSSYNRNKSL